MTLPRRVVQTLLLCLFLPAYSFGSAYDARPKLVVIVVIDQFRADYLERYRDQLGEGGFGLFPDHGAYFIDCNNNYANTRTAPEPVDLAVTLASLLGINAPTHAIGRVLTEAIVARRNEASGRPSQRAPGNSEKIEPAFLVTKEGVR
jgi:hypothetical protein